MLGDQCQYLKITAKPGTRVRSTEKTHCLLQSKALTGESLEDLKTRQMMKELLVKGGGDEESKKMEEGEKSPAEILWHKEERRAGECRVQ